MERIGTGGMSEVFLAKTEGIEGFERKVALKRIFSSLTEHPEFVQSFIHEAKIGGMLYHHNVVQTLDFGRYDGAYFIALEYIEGTNLGQVLHRCREERLPLPTGVFLQIALQICEGLEYIHHARIEGADLKLVHRDIKPSNMLITTQGLVKISDFGVVKAESQLGGMTTVGSVKGTIGYMSPEQARGAEVSPVSDLYSLGAVLYEMATLRRLYGEGDELQILNRVRDAAFQIPIEAAGAYIPGLDRVLKRLLSQDPKGRYAGADQVAAALRALPVVLTDRPSLVAFIRSLSLLEGRPKETGPRAAVQDFAEPPGNGVKRASLEPAGLETVPIRTDGRDPDPRPSDPRLSIPAAMDGRIPAPGSSDPRLSGPRYASFPEVEVTAAAPTFETVRGASGGGSHWQSVLVALGVTLLALGGGAGSYFLVDSQLQARSHAVPPVAIRPPPSPRNSAAGPPVVVDLQTVPPGATVLVNGVPVAASTPAQVPVYDGQQISVQLEGYREWRRQVEADPDHDSQQWVVTLTPAE
jgi:serine/threonine protein kinase